MTYRKFARHTSLQAMCLPWCILGLVLALGPVQLSAGWYVVAGFVWVATIINLAERVVEGRRRSRAIPMALFVAPPLLVIGGLMAWR